MLTRPTAKRFFVLAVPALVVAGVCLVPPAWARVVVNTINPIVTLSNKGRHLVVTGPLACDRVQWVDLQVTVTQRDTGAVAEGRVRVLGTPEPRIWTLEASAIGDNAFVAGPAQAVALATTTFRGTTDDARQWLVDVTLRDAN